jgi:hypothetical protein
MSLSDGVISSLDGIDLRPGETIVDGPPELQQYQTQQASQPQVMQGQPSGSGYSAGCYVPCEPGYYLVSETLFMQQTSGDGFTRGFGYFFDDHDFELAPRITFGRRFDCVDGYEFVFAGLLEWDDAIVGTNNAAVFESPDAILQDAFDLYATAANQTQVRESSFNSFEFNRTYTGWDVARTMIGLRTILYDEEYAYIAGGTDAPGSVALSQSSDNLLIGPQLGLQLIYPVGIRTYTETTLKGGAYLNFVDTDTSLFSPIGAAPLATGAGDEVELAGMLEIGSKIGINLTRSVSAHVGYDLWYMAGIAESASQLPIGFNRATPFTVSADDDVFIHGLTGGVQVVY